MRMVMSSMTLQKAWIQTRREKIKGQQGESLSAFSDGSWTRDQTLPNLGRIIKQDLLLAK